MIQQKLRKCLAGQDLQQGTLIGESLHSHEAAQKNEELRPEKGNIGRNVDGT
jgi:hypothetical protein